MATLTKSIRLTPAEQKRINALARQRGLSPATYIKRAALAGPPPSDGSRLAKLERVTAAVLEAIEDEIDYRVASVRWESHKKNQTRLLTGGEARRELGLPD